MFHTLKRRQHGRRFIGRRLLYRMNSRLLKILLVIAFALIVALLLIGSCAKGQETDAAPSPSAAPSTAVQTTPEPTPETTPSTAVPTETPSASPSETPQASPEPTASAAPSPSVNTPTPSGPIAPPSQPTPPLPTATVPTASPDTPKPTGSTVPYGDRVDDDWFSDAAFLGNALVDGFRLFSGLTTCDVYAATSMTVLGAGTLITQMNAKQYGKVYILLGINEIGYDADYFKSQYASMLDTIMAGQPNADIYIMGLTPISEQKSNSDSTFTMSRVSTYNQKLLDLAYEKGCYYIDLCEALSDESGYLPANVTTDGIHFAASHYQVWLEYLRTHHA